MHRSDTEYRASSVFRSLGENTDRGEDRVARLFASPGCVLHRAPELFFRLGDASCGMGSGPAVASSRRRFVEKSPSRPGL